MIVLKWDKEGVDLKKQLHSRIIQGGECPPKWNPIIKQTRAEHERPKITSQSSGLYVRYYYGGHSLIISSWLYWLVAVCFHCHSLSGLPSSTSTSSVSWRGPRLDEQLINITHSMINSDIMCNKIDSIILNFKNITQQSVYSRCFSEWVLYSILQYCIYFCLIIHSQNIHVISRCISSFIFNHNVGVLSEDLHKIFT